MSKLVLRYLLIVLLPAATLFLVRIAYTFYKWVSDIVGVPEAAKMAEACTVFLVVIIAASVFVDYTYTRANKKNKVKR